jgi:hypothetical protein
MLSPLRMFPLNFILFLLLLLLSLFLSLSLSLSLHPSVFSRSTNPLCSHVFLALRGRYGEPAVAACLNQVYLMFSSKPLLLMKSQYE